MKKENKTYYFSVEGYTERWYLQWLQKAINDTTEAEYTVKFNSMIQPNPVSYVKNITILGKTNIYHIFDFESNEDIHVKEFYGTLDNMKKAERLGKKVKYYLGYSNFTFELWMILHKMNCKRQFANRTEYLGPLNQAYGTKFESLGHYKEENNFKGLLDSLTIANVKDAIQRSEKIMQGKEDLGHVLCEYKGFKFYRENPALSVGEVIELVFKECGLYAR